MRWLLVGLGIVAMVALAALAAPWWNIPRDQADSAGMLAHLHALFVDADLLYDDEYAALQMSPLFAFVTDEGVVSNHWPAGASWLQAPGYGLGIVAAKALAGLGIGRGSALGVVVVLAVRAWAVLVLAAMTIAVARLCAAAQPDPDTPGAHRAGRLIAAGIVLGTPWLYYAAEAPLRPHLWGAGLTLATVALWGQPDRGSPHARTMALAALTGLATYVRPQLAPLCLLVAHDAWSGPERWRRLLLGAVIFVPWPLLHVRTQWWMYGSQLSDYAGSVSHHLSYFLLSTHHGVVPWCPVIVLALVAMGVSAARRERGAWLLLGLVLVQLWVDSGMRAIEPRAVLGTRTWSGGVSFGPRKLVEVLPLMLPAFASLVALARARGYGRSLAGLAVVLCLPTVLLHISAWLDPEATTGGIMGSMEYRAALRRPFEPEAWSVAWAQRGVPLGVPVVVTAIVTLPLLLLGIGGAAWIRRCSSAAATRLASSRAVAVGVVLVLLLMHGWLSVLLVRSDITREDEPRRMLDAAQAMTPAHYATVRRIEAHHEQLRRRLGPSAAPPR